jgi:uncharacterized protein YbaP (TraB family)
MSLRVFTLLLLGLACWQFAWAEQAPPAVDDAADYVRKIESAPPRGLFYEISKDGASAFLFGTLHVGKPDFFPLERAATQALVHSTALAVEVDATQADKMQAAMRHYAVLPDGGQLDALLDPALQKRLRTQADALDMPHASLQAFKPWMAALTLTMGAIHKSGFDAGYATDGFLIGLAQGLDKPVTELESIDEQLGLFDAMPRADQIAFLDEVLLPIEKGTLAPDTQALVAAWLAGDTAALQRLSQKSLDESPRTGPWMKQKLFTERNHRMAQRIERLLADGQSPFVAVGALHLVGPDGLPALLAKRGYRIKNRYPVNVTHN